MLMLIAEYGLCLPANESRTWLLNGRVRGTTAGFTQKLTVTCHWASLREIDEVKKKYFPGISETNTDATGIFFLDGEPSLEVVVTPDHYLRNATLTGTAWFDSNMGEEPRVDYEIGQLTAP